MNSKLLTSPFDIYSTIRDLTCLNPVLSNLNYPNRSISLLNKISPHRNCEHIGISDHFCTCVQNWQKLAINKDEVRSAAAFTINSINKMILLENELCFELSLKQIISAEILQKDFGQIYKIQFITSPNSGIYETMLINGIMDGYEFISDAFSIKSRNDISRIDSYGEQPLCIADFSNNPTELLDIRKFCFCKKQKKFRKKNNKIYFNNKLLIG